MKRIDTNELMSEIGLSPAGKMLGVAHLVPRRFEGQTSIIISRQNQMAHVGASDDFVEFRQEPKGVITGVAYQMGPQNDFRFNKTRTTLIQAPKVIVSEEVDTLFAVINASTSFDYQDTAHLEYWIYGPSGNKIAKGSIKVPPGQSALLVPPKRSNYMTKRQNSFLKEVLEWCWVCRGIQV